MKGRQLGKKKLALGKGIASLLEIDTEEREVEGFEEAAMRQVKRQEKGPEEETFTGMPLMVSTKNITVNPYQPRKMFREAQLRELADSIRENGIIQPIVVSQAEDNKFEIISGERRFRAGKMAGLEQVPILVRRSTDREKLVVAIIENVQRSDLNCIEEALAYYQLMDEFNLTQEEVAKKVGKERSTIANFLRILKLPRDVVELLQREELSFGHGKVLAAIKDREECTRIAKRTWMEGLSVRRMELLIKKDKKQEKPRVERDSSQQNFVDENLDSLKMSLEKRTGRHFLLKGKRDGSGQIIIKYNDREEFNNIFEYLMR